MLLATPIQTYFTAQGPQDGAALAAAFAADAIVHDEGRSHHGRQDILAWWLAAKTKYRHHAVPIDVTEADGKTIVRAMVTGDFPTSPAVLTFTFVLAHDRITELRVG